jgi:hypothetical protein
MFKILRRRELQDQLWRMCQNHIMTTEQTPQTPRFINGSVLGALALARKATMRARPISAVVFCACTVSMFNAAANAADISWGTPTTISGTSDVSLDGTLVGTWGPGDDWGGFNRSDYYPVNGVTFATYGNGPFGSWVSD